MITGRNYCTSEGWSVKRFCKSETAGQTERALERALHRTRSPKEASQPERAVPVQWFAVILIEKLRERNRRQKERWKSIPNSSVALVIALGFCLFSAIGSLVQLDSSRVLSAAAWMIPLITGIYAAAMVWIVVRATTWWPAVAVAIFFSGTLVLVERYTMKASRQSVPLPADMHRWLSVTSLVTILLITAGWALALQFINREGERLFRVETEMKLAGEIHRALVPVVDCRIGEYEFYGVSHPSGMVGGDLVDVFHCGDRWVAYVADVSGHGVASGVVMAMIKSSIHTALQHQMNAGCLFDEVNRVLCSLQLQHMFATCGAVAFSPEEGLQYVLAGHLPLVRAREETIEMLHESNLPLGIFGDRKFQAFPCDMKIGDLLAVVSDGLTEVIAGDGDELGFRGISKALMGSSKDPLRDLAAETLRTADSAARNDDQTLLLVRRVG